MKKLFIAVVVLLLSACASEPQPQVKFLLNKPADPQLAALAEQALPKLVAACPGLDRYAADLSAATVSKSSMRDYDGGITLEFTVSGQPQSLPQPLAKYSAHQHCFIDIHPSLRFFYISKSACHSICDGQLHGNDTGLMGREFLMP